MFQQLASATVQYSPIAIRRVEKAGQSSNSHTAATPDNCGESEPPGARPPQSRTRKQPAAPDDAGIKETNSPVLSPLVQHDIVDVPHDDAHATALERSGGGVCKRLAKSCREFSIQCND